MKHAIEGTSSKLIVPGILLTLIIRHPRLILKGISSIGIARGGLVNKV